MRTERQVPAELEGETVGGGGGGLGKLRGRGGIWALEIQHLGRDVEISRTARKVERDVRVWNRGLLGYGGTREDVS